MLPFSSASHSSGSASSSGSSVCTNRKRKQDESGSEGEKKYRTEEKEGKTRSKWETALEAYYVERISARELVDSFLVRNAESGGLFMELGSVRILLMCGDMEDYKAGIGQINLQPAGFWEYALESFWRNSSLYSVKHEYGFSKGFAFYDAIVVHTDQVCASLAPSLIRRRAAGRWDQSFFQIDPPVTGTEQWLMAGGGRPCDNLLLWLSCASARSRIGCVDGVWLPVWDAWCRYTSASTSQQIQTLCLLLAYVHEPFEASSMFRFRGNYGIPRIDQGCIFPPTHHMPYDAFGIARTLTCILKDLTSEWFPKEDEYSVTPTATHALEDCLRPLFSANSVPFGFAPSPAALLSGFAAAQVPLLPPLIKICLDYCIAP